MSAISTTKPTRRRRGIRTGALLLALATVALLGLAGSASAVPLWKLYAASNPSATPGEQVEYLVIAKNLGDRPAPETLAGDDTNCEGGPAPDNCMSLTASFPAGITPVSVEGPGVCAIDGGTNSVRCGVSGSADGQQRAPGKTLSMSVITEVAASVGATPMSSFEVTGGGGGTDTAVRPIAVVSAPPEFGIATFDGEVTDAADGALTQAGGRPHAASTTFEFNAVTNPNPLVGSLWPIEPPRRIAVDLPPGFVGDPTGIEKCAVSDLANSEVITPRPLCPPTSQIGVTTLRMNGGRGSNTILGPYPVFNIEPTDDVPARFGFNVLGTIVLLDAELRSDTDYGLSVVVHNAPQAVAVQGTEVTLWGDPSDRSHDHERACSGEFAPSEGGPNCDSGAPPTAFLRNPTRCTERDGLPTGIRVSSWVDVENVKTAEFITHLPPGYPLPREDWGDEQGTTGCGGVPFRPTLSGQPPADAKAGTPSAFAFDLAVPQTDRPNIIGTSDLRKAVVTLPEGVRVSPSSADGLAACSSGQIGLDSRADPTCPENSKIGSLTIDTPLLDRPLSGSVYLATPFDNPFNSLIAIYLVARGPGIIVKLPGHVSPDASKNGQLTATFDNQPQLPFSNLHLEFKGGPRAPVVLPKKCGTYTTHAVLTGWNGREVATDSAFTVDDGCSPGGFNPRLSAGIENPSANRSSAFNVRITRSDSDEEISSLSVHLPDGLVGRVADVPLCGLGDARNGTCPESSRVGGVTVGAGSGPFPFYISSPRVYLTDRYGQCGPDQPGKFGLSIVVPAIAGPFNLGNVIVQSAICVNRLTSELTVSSDPLPVQLQGIPLDVKDIRVTVDRPGFIDPPSDCQEKQITGVIRSTAGSVANVSDRFQVGDCAALPLTPRMSLTVGGRGRTQRGRTTPFTATLRQGSDEASLERVQVTLPTTINARLTVINDACTRAEFDAGRCEDARTGTAIAKTPLLREALTGGVYFVRNGHPLPDLFVGLRGQVDFDLIGRITIPGSKRLRTTFDSVPDVPISQFTLKLNAGRDGSIGNAANLCSRRGRRARAALSFVGQNGKTLNVRQRLKIRGCRARRARGRRSRRRGRR